ncbi:alpha-mannosidases/ glycoside hydrolase family 38 [Cyanobium sp. NS01]|nr:alpha-mannosidase [Cyanobium sp. NS01]QNI71776.1 alpha-mannosidases/ glycoside hydrolase family 38 [Cyanobium sp. NS01]
MIWPRGGHWTCLTLQVPCPGTWQAAQAETAGLRARLALRWWADQAELWVDGARVHCGDLFDTSCRWPLPQRWWRGEALRLELRLRSPLHDDGALIHSSIELEPLDLEDPLGVLQPARQALLALRQQAGQPEALPPGAGLHVLGHAHLDLAWLWPVADTWRAAERTFCSALDLIDRFPDLHFAHSTPALYAWLERQRPALLRRLQAAVRAGRFEPINGPWVESDCVLISTASLLRQFQEGQHDSRRRFPGLSHQLAWLPDSFGFGAGLPAVAAATDVRWFCTHKLFWNATNPFPHRLFRWRSRCGSELLALMSAPIGTDGDPLAMERHRLEWKGATGLPQALWLPGVGDHGGGPTAEMLEQLELWRHQPEAAPQTHGSLRSFLAGLEPLRPQLPVWRDELYLELHRGCATTRPDQKRHNRTLERLLREAGLAAVLAGGRQQPDWQPLLFQQFHDILPGTAIPEVFEQAEPVWRAARRQARASRDRHLQQWLGLTPSGPPDTGQDGPERWWAVQLQPLAARRRVRRLPAGCWSAAGALLPQQGAAAGGNWVQLPALAGVVAQPLECHAAVAAAQPPQPQSALVDQPVWTAGQRAGNGLIAVELGQHGIEQLWDQAGRSLLAEPLRWCRYADRGQFWDAWDLAPDHADHPLPWPWQGAPVWRERGPLCASFVWRGRFGRSRVRLEGRLLAATPWLELTLSIDWHQRHELLRLELPLAEPAQRWAADTSGGVLERPAVAVTAREQARWEVAAISWLATAGRGGGLAVLLDGPQGVSCDAGRLGVSLLRAPTWPDPGADNGRRRQRLALMAAAPTWAQAAIPDHAQVFREPLWLGRAASAGDRRAAPLDGLPPLAEGLALLGLWPSRETSKGTPAQAVIAVANQSACRRRLELGPGWTVLARVNGLEETVAAGQDRELQPWQLGFWRLSRND